MALLLALLKAKAKANANELGLALTLIAPPHKSSRVTAMINTGTTRGVVMAGRTKFSLVFVVVGGGIFFFFFFFSC